MLRIHLTYLYQKVLMPHLYTTDIHQAVLQQHSALLDDRRNSVEPAAALHGVVPWQISEQFGGIILSGNTYIYMGVSKK